MVTHKFTQPNYYNLQPFVVYLCGPITGDKITWRWRADVREPFHTWDVGVLDPLHGKDLSKLSQSGLKLEGGDHPWPSPDLFVARDTQNVQQANAILCVVQAPLTRQSIGTWMELGMAVIMQAPIIMYVNAERLTEEERRLIVDHPFIQKHVTVQAESIEEAVDSVLYLAHRPTTRSNTNA